MSQEKLHDQPLFFSEEQLQMIDRSLLRLSDHIAAPLVMLADISGRLVLYRGRLSAKQSTGLAALAAGSLMAGVEMGRFLGLRDKNSFGQQLHEGATANLYTIVVDKDLLLIIAYTHKTNLGLVKVFSSQTKKELNYIAKEAAKTREEETARQKAFLNQNDNLESDITTQLDELFNDF